MKKPAYSYKVKEIIKVLDGDTVDLLIDLGFHVFVKKRVRLYGINAPETRTRDLKEKKLGLASKEKLKSLLSAKELILESHGLGKYGRVIGTIHHEDIDINRTMVLEGFASAYEFSK